jgi:hypothetical protein
MLEMARLKTFPDKVGVPRCHGKNTLRRSSVNMEKRTIPDGKLPTPKKIT